MLHRAHSAVARWTGVRSTERSPADRLTDLLVPGGGWLPPEADEPSEEKWPGEEEWPEESRDEPLRALTDQWLGEAAEEPFHALREDPEDGGERSWAPAGRHATVEPARWWRLELGRAAVGALLVVAALAALIAAGVVLRGRPQEVAAPVLDARAAAGSGAASHHAGKGTADGGGPPVVEATGVPLPGGTEPGRPMAPPGDVVVAVAGKVRTPGLVRLPAGSRVDDAVKAAGGPVDPAALGLLNLARVLVDGEQVLVGVEAPPGSAPAVGAPAAGPAGAAGGGLLDLNAASASELDGLPGIGPVLAQRIVDWRTENGRFASVDQLREVTGIGEAKYQELVAKVVV